MTQADKTESTQDPWPIIKAQSRTFFKAPICDNLDELDAEVALIGVPFDQGTLGRPGARFGPDAVRDAPRTYNLLGPLRAAECCRGLLRHRRAG